MIQISINKLLKNRVLQHTLFWLLSYYVLLQMFASSTGIQKIDCIYTALFHVSLIIGVYINLYILIPNFLSNKKYFQYIFLLLIVIAGSSELNIVFFDKLVDIILPGYYFISYYEFTDILKFVVVYIVVTSLVKLAKSWFKLSDANKKLSELQKEKIETELNALKGQINPHFLFNSLNVLYSLVLKQSPESPDAIIKLSDILRYVIYGSNKDYVNLNEEIKLINDYLGLQKFRIDKDSKVDFNYDIEDDNLKIAPMLLLPLVENSFKHGIKGDIFQTYVHITLKAGKREICFEIKNNKGFAEQKEPDKPSGIGLSNIKNRLSLIYPGMHIFEIKETDNFFQVTLIIRNEN
jgi:sensor histidine kinase YesM